MPQPLADRRALGVALVIGSACFFGSLGVFGRLAYRIGLTTPQLLSYRFALAAVLLWAAAFLMHQQLPSQRALIGLAIMGIGYVGQSAAYFSALHYIPASTNALLLYTYPVVVTLLAALLFAEGLGVLKLAAVAVSFLGTVLVVQAQITHSASPLGLLLSLASALCYSGYILFGSRLLPGLPPVSSTAAIMTSAAIVWSAYTAVTSQLVVHWNLPRVALILSFAVVGTTIPVLTFIMGLPLVGASRTAILSTFEPASTVLFAVIILGESANAIQYLGGALILAAVVILEGPGWHASRVLAQATRE